MKKWLLYEINNSLKRCYYDITYKLYKLNNIHNTTHPMDNCQRHHTCKFYFRFLFSTSFQDRPINTFVLCVNKIHMECYERTFHFQDDDGEENETITVIEVICIIC